MIGNYDLEILTPACDPGSPRLVATASFVDDISAVVPYFNATLPGADDFPEANALIWEDTGPEFTPQLVNLRRLLAEAG